MITTNRTYWILGLLLVLSVGLFVLRESTNTIPTERAAVEPLDTKTEGSRPDGRSDALYEGGRELAGSKGRPPTNEPGWVEVQVRDALTRQPLLAKIESPYGTTRTSRSSGGATIHVPDMPMECEVTSEGYWPASVLLEASVHGSLVEVGLERERRSVITVIDDSGSPVTGAVVHALSSEPHWGGPQRELMVGQTDSNGMLACGLTGTWLLYSSSANGASPPQWFELEQGSATLVQTPDAKHVARFMDFRTGGFHAGLPVVFDGRVAGRDVILERSLDAIGEASLPLPATRFDFRLPRELDLLGPAIDHSSRSSPGSFYVVMTLATSAYFVRLESASGEVLGKSCLVATDIAVDDGREPIRYVTEVLEPDPDGILTIPKDWLPTLGATLMISVDGIPVDVPPVSSLSTDKEAPTVLALPTQQPLRTHLECGVCGGSYTGPVHVRVEGSTTPLVSADQTNGYVLLGPLGEDRIEVLAGPDGPPIAKDAQITADGSVRSIRLSHVGRIEIQSPTAEGLDLHLLRKGSAQRETLYMEADRLVACHMPVGRYRIGSPALLRMPGAKGEQPVDGVRVVDLEPGQVELVNWDTAALSDWTLEGQVGAWSDEGPAKYIAPLFAGSGRAVAQPFIGTPIQADGRYALRGSGPKPTALVLYEEYEAGGQVPLSVVTPNEGPDASLLPAPIELQGLDGDEWITISMTSALPDHDLRVPEQEVFRGRRSQAPALLRVSPLTALVTVFRHSITDSQSIVVGNEGRLAFRF